MSSPIPQSPIPKSGGYSREPDSFSTFNDLFRFFASKKLKVSRNSPPVLNVDVKEGEMIWDRTLLRLYTVSDGALRYVQFT